MLCEKCKKNNATVKIVKNYNGIITEKHLCQVCAGNDEFNFSEFFFSKEVQYVFRS